LAEVAFPFPADAVISAQQGAKTVTLDAAKLADPATAAGPVDTLANFLNPSQFNPGDDGQVELGDPNGDGVFGYDLHGALIKPGDPLKSYLFLRVLGPLAVGPGQVLTNVMADPSESRPQMPAANQRYWDIDNAVVALWCWIQSMKPDASNADGAIDYDRCDLTGYSPPKHAGNEASTYTSIYQATLGPTCAGPCHHTGNGQGTTLFMEDAQTTYDTLLGIRGSGPSETMMFPYVTRGDPQSSFLYLKLTDNPGVGARMPRGGTLSDDAMKAIETWITQGANEN
jgi:hypothetical protein